LEVQDEADGGDVCSYSESHKTPPVGEEEGGDRTTTPNAPIRMRVTYSTEGGGDQAGANINGWVVGGFRVSFQ